MGSWYIAGSCDIVIPCPVQVNILSQKHAASKATMNNGINPLYLPVFSKYGFTFIMLLAANLANLIPNDTKHMKNGRVGPSLSQENVIVGSH